MEQKTSKVRRSAASLISALPEAERRQILVDWNATERAYPRELSVARLFEAQVERGPNAVAVADGVSSLSYAELNVRANRLAHELVARGVRMGDCVAVALERSAELVVAELAVLKAGAAYVPLDASLPLPRLSFMLADTDARVVITSSATTLPEAIETSSVLQKLDLEDPSVSLRPVHNLSLALDGAATAYVMYTSGSTGTPKGVLVPHRAITRLVMACGYAEFGPADRVALASNPAFDASTMEVWGPLLNGGAVVVVHAADLRDPQRLANVLEEQRVSVLFITTALFNHYARTIPQALANLGCLLTGGERADPESFARLLAVQGRVRVVHCYGPTESTTFALTLHVESVATDAKSVPLGRPIGNTTAYVLDERAQVVPVGVTGEIYVGGDGVALGYLNQPTLTAERFLRDPFNARAEARMYRTGDLGRWLPDGTIEFVGRNDFQVKLRGYRIELGEIEACLSSVEGVAEVVVLAREDQPGERRLVAYYSGDTAPEVKALREHAKATLPPYMVPAAYLQLERLPLSSNGKVDRKALPAPREEGSAVSENDAADFDGDEPFQGELEAALAEIWAVLLQLERVGRRDDFFVLGGHSLLALQLVSRVQVALGLDMAVADVFEAPVLWEQAQRLAGARSLALEPILPAERGKDLPLSLAQQRMWFLSQLEMDRSAYHISGNFAAARRPPDRRARACAFLHRGAPRGSAHPLRGARRSTDASHRASVHLETAGE